MASVVNGNTAFALDLFHVLREQEGNLFWSPSSISTALAMTWAGARTETEQQMAQTLHFGLEQEALHAAFRCLATELAQRDAGDAVDLAVSNRLWGQAGDSFQTEFVELVQREYAGSFETLDFISDAERARRTINDWVEQQTRHRIRELLQPGDVDATTALVLTNAVYFRGDWAARFDPEHTRDGLFFVGPDDAVTTPLMQQTGTFGYFENEQLQLLELPYEGDELSMVVILPRDRDGLSALEEAFTPEQLATWLGESTRQTVRVTLPRFEMTSRFSLADVLAEMGMPLAFSAHADFTGLNSAGNLFIDAVIHKAWVKVNEAGTEAAASTGVVVSRGSIERHPVFRADHPFVFMIRDRATGSILFLGRLADPTR